MPPSVFHRRILIALLAFPALAQPPQAARRVTISNTSSLTASPPGLAFDGKPGWGNPNAQTFFLNSSDGGTFQWTATPSQPWLTVSPTSGSGPATLTVTTSLTGLSPSEYNGGISIAVVIPPSLSVGPGTLSFTAAAGGSDPFAQTVSIGNLGGGTLNWTASKTQPWLSLSTSSGSGPQTIAVRAAVGTLPPGVYSDTITINAPGASPSTATVAVTFVVSGQSGLTASPPSFSFQTTAAGGDPPPQVLSLATSVSWSISKTQPWLALSSGAGTGSTNVSVQAAAGGLAPGTYQDTITINAPGTSPAVTTFPVTLTVAGQATFSVSPGLLSYGATAGAGNPPAQNVAVSLSNSSMSWTASKTQPWVTLGPASGTGSGSVSVQVQANSLGAGVYSDTITFSAPGASPATATVAVSFTVSALPNTGSANTDQWAPNPNPPQSFDSNGGPVLYNGIQLPAAWPPQNPPSQAFNVAPYLGRQPAVIPIDGGRQLFVDDFLIAQTTLGRVQHQPVFFAGNPVIAPGTQGMDNNNLALVYSDGVWYDPADHLYKMWYDGGIGNDVCYAYSTDGLQWTKPNLVGGLVPNKVLELGGARDSTTVWMDLHDDSSRKFKLFAYFPDNNTAYLTVYYSPDGIQWTGPQANRGLSLSDRTTVFYNPFRHKWVESARLGADLPATSQRAEKLARARYYAESSDLQSWTPGDPQTSFWTSADDRDPPYPGSSQTPELYSLDATPYESLLVGLFSFYYPSDGPDLVELNVGFSRDGFHWSRPTRGAGPSNALIPASNQAGAWNGYNTQSAGGGFLVVGDQLYFYFSGRDARHNSENAGTRRSTGLATLRRDGFYSMDAGSPGTLTARPVRFSGSHLFVNVADPNGQLQVEVLDANGAVIPAFAKSNAAVISADSTAREVTWSGASLSSLAGQTVQFRFYLTNGSLYSFWVSSSASGASNGYVAAGGPGFTSDIDTIGRQ